MPSPTRDRVAPGPSPVTARLRVEVRPRASRDEVLVGPDGTVRVWVTAPPVDGEANQAVREVIARALHCPRAAVAIERGAAARTKLLRVAGLSAESVRARLGAAR